MSGKSDEKKMAAKVLHYYVSDLSNVDPLGLHLTSCDVSQKHTVADYMTSIERKHYENQNLCRKNGIRGQRNKDNGGGCGRERKRLKRPAPPPPTTKKTLKDMAQDYFTTLDTDYVVTDLNTVAVATDPTDSFLQLTTEPSAPVEDHLYDTISGHYKKKGVNNGGQPSQKQDAYYLDIIDDYSKPAFPSSSCSYDEIKCKTLSLSRHKNLQRDVYSSANWEFLNRTKEMMMTKLFAKLPATKSRRVISIFVVAILLLCSIWLAAVASKPKNTNGLIFPTQTHLLMGGTVFHPGVTLPEPTSSPPVIPESDCLLECSRHKLHLRFCGSDMITYDSCELKVAQCKDPNLFIKRNGPCYQDNSDEMEDD